MDYELWHSQVLRVAMICGQCFLDGLYDETLKSDNNCFVNLFELLDVDVEETSDSEKKKALYFAIMASSYSVQEQQEKLVQNLIK